MDYNTRLQSNNAELNKIYNALISLPETESDVIRLQYAPGDRINNVEEVYQAYQNGKYILVEGEHTFFSTKTGNTVTATFAIPLVSANRDYIFEFKGADSYDNVISLAYIQVLGWVDVIIERGDPKLQDKATTPNQWTQTIQADFEEYDGLGTVTVYPIPDEYIVPSGTLEIIENGEYDVADKAGVIVSVASGGTAAVEEKDVNFYDYDGTLLYSYTLAEAQALSSLPPLPEHDGLICQGWNWTLADIKSFAEPLDVGASYITDDGKTRLYLNIPTELGLTVPLHIQQTAANGVTIDWGDGSPTETIAGTGAVTKTHAYASAGKYCLTLLPSTSCTMQLGNGTLNVVGRPNDYSKPTRIVIYKAEIGRGVTQISTNAFNYATGLETVTIPQGVTRIGTRGFQYCQILKFIVLPSGCTNIDTSAFTTCNRINMISIPKSLSSFGGSSPCSEMASHKRVIMPDTVNYLGATAFSGNRALQKVRLSKNITSIGGNAFDNCWNLKELDVPAKVTSIAALAFRYCYSLGRLKFNSATPPAVANANAFTSIPTDCVVEVPNLATYQAATNYGTIATQMVEV